jgi:hypothetical protein
MIKSEAGRQMSFADKQQTSNGAGDVIHMISKERVK